jgi:hypothetical protein
MVRGGARRDGCEGGPQVGAGATMVHVAVPIRRSGLL